MREAAIDHLSSLRRETFCRFQLVISDRNFKITQVSSHNPIVEPVTLEAFSNLNLEFDG
jgi:hypothetical protein